MTRQEHKLEMGWRMTELIEAVRDEERATRRRESAVDQYEKALDALLSDVPVQEPAK
jgi:macrodomain Ter protein organizer (MatP/YcbG family)